MTAALGALAVLIGAALQSATGFGFALMAAPLLVAIYGPRPAVSAMVVLAILVSTLTLAGERRRPRADIRETVTLVAWSLPGLFAGALVLEAAPQRALKVLVAAVVLAAVGLRLRGARREHAWSHPRTALTGVVSGVLSTSTGIGGPPLVFHLLGRGLERGHMRDTLAVVFLAGGVLSVGALLVTGAFDLPGDLVLLVAGTLTGQIAGRRLFRLLHGERYERAVLGALVLTALISLVAALV